MIRVRTLGVAALALALAVMVSSTKAADETKKKEHAGVHGVVVKIVKDTDKTGSFTIKQEEKNAKTAGTQTTAAKADVPAEETTFKVTADTKFTQVAHKKKDASAADAKAEPEGEAATFGDLKEGDVVVVEAKDGVALSVKFHTAHKKKPAA
jgi:hypothetical protein